MLSVIRSRLLLVLRPQIEAIYVVLENLLARQNTPHHGSSAVAAPASPPPVVSAFAGVFGGAASSTPSVTATTAAHAQAIKFSSYKVPQPFTFYRLLLVELITEIVTYDPTQGLSDLYIHTHPFKWS